MSLMEKKRFGCLNEVLEIIYIFGTNYNVWDKIEELLEDYPSLTIEDIHACLDYAASLAEEQITPLEIIENIV